ncbi:NAP1-related protein 2 isoform X1 [Cryptomeria japonica]|uniref:NAP1-related protein 2 isoform X1 n=1 Tax=Cryptomeria japonica TaxID=3369 RepID=UPI0027D9FB3E|nr:NAP1-related protein 2 isoform X1 [Cryptomeria japonica]
MADKVKKTKVEDVNLDSELILAIEKLQEIQEELEKVNEEASDKVLEVEQKYNEIRRPVYEKRNDLIQTIPEFWLTAFLSHPALCDLLTEEDQKVFKYLQSIDVEDFKDVKSGYSISFTFRPNPYFEDTKLTKVFRFTDELTTSVSGSMVKWKDGMDLTNGVVPDKEGRKRSLQEESFFKWFSETQQKVPSDVIHDEVAEIIKEDLWPNPLKYFNNVSGNMEADEEDYEDDDDNEDAEDPVSQNMGKGDEHTDEDDDEQDEDDEVDDA